MLFIFRERILISTFVDNFERDQLYNTHADLRFSCSEYKLIYIVMLLTYLRLKDRLKQFTWLLPSTHIYYLIELNCRKQFGSCSSNISSVTIPKECSVVSDSTVRLNTLSSL